MDEIIEQLKKNVRDELIADGQSEKYFQNIWGLWWGMMSTDIQNGLLKTFKELNEKSITLPGRCEYNGKTYRILDIDMQGGYFTLQDLDAKKGDIQVLDNIDIEQCKLLK
jgi:hypothetical protein